MNVVLALLILVVSFFLLIIGGNKFVDASVAISKKVKIPVAIIGATIVSLGTTIPELLVTIFSASSNASAIAVGNSVGTVIFNIGLIGGFLLLSLTIRNRKKLRADYILLITVLVLLFIFSMLGNINLIESILLIVLFVVYLIISFLYGKKEKHPEVSVKYKKPTWQYIILFVLSAGLIAVGAYFLTESAKYLATMVGLSQEFIGLTIINFGTSLPELITAINSIRKKEIGLSLGNIIGTSVINTTLLIGMSGVLNSDGLNIAKQIIFVSIPVAIAVSLILILPMLIKKRTFKWQGISLICLFSAYYAFLTATTFGWLKIF